MKGDMVELAAITALDMNLHETFVPEHVASNVYKVTSKVFTQSPRANAFFHKV